MKIAFLDWRHAVSWKYIDVSEVLTAPINSAIALMIEAV
jgi:hypothetical protein